MSTSTASWIWHVTETLPGFDADSDENLDASENGMSIDPSTYTNATWEDDDDDGKIADTDGDDASTSTNDTVTIGGDDKVVAEMARYQDSTVTIDGVTYTVDLPVWVFEDGTYGVRLNDADIPAGTHWSDVTEITLGEFRNNGGRDDDSSGGEYSHSWVSTRDEFFACFTAGTYVQTSDGAKPIQTLQVGDLVCTQDHGLQPLRWIGKRRVAGNGAMAPIRFMAGAIGNTDTLLVSPQHRMLITGWRAELMFGCNEVLVAAKHLINGETICQTPMAEVEYIHILFDRHEIVFAEDCPSESFHPGAQCLSTLDHAARTELFTLFPELQSHPTSAGKTARMCLTAHEALALFAA